MLAGRWALVTIAVVSIAARAVPAAACAGDCDGNGAVAIHELITLVNVALDRVGIDRCSAGDLDRDGDVSVDEIVSGVNVALDGCLASVPTPTATPWSCTYMPGSTPVGVLPASLTVPRSFLSIIPSWPPSP